MDRSRRAGICALVLADVVALTLLRPDPSRLVHNLAAPREWLAQVGPDRALAAFGAAALWLAAAWIGLGLLAAASSNLPGALGRFSTQLCRAVLPPVLRRLVAGSAGLGVFLVPVIAGARQVPEAASPTTSISISTDGLPAPVWPSALPAPVWPVTPSDAPARTPAPPASSLPAPSPTSSRPARPPTRSSIPPPAPASSLPAPPQTRASIPPPRRPTRAPHPATPSPVAPVPATRHDSHTAAVRVHAGDCLWLLAARRLGPHATDAQIAADWPRCPRANRDVIGDDSALITPGQVLHVPAPSAQEPR